MIMETRAKQLTPNIVLVSAKDLGSLVLCGVVDRQGVNGMEIEFPLHCGDRKWMVGDGAS